MSYNKRGYFCYKCDSNIYQNEYHYSFDEFGLALCRSCQNWNRYKLRETTQETINLFLVLKRKGVPAILEKYDGHKTIDIAVPEAKLNIEVDGQHHNYKLISHHQVSQLKGYPNQSRISNHPFQILFAAMCW